ncbi:MAG TPA: ribosome biogenesis factor YjgA [Steroidobacteraceae bacterium]|nr:ribosome biogenesis factor YjgA [Steroidobacteraceae bacterium]
MTSGRDSDADDAATGRPSKSSLKRAAHAAQDLGEALIGLPDGELAALALPEELAAAVRAARRITSRAAAARQRQYIGKLMRTLDSAPIRAALAARGAVSAREAERFRRVEEWRERLIAGGSVALAELVRAHPGIDATEWARRVSAAQSERARRAGRSRRSRELFRALRALFDTMP